MVDIEGIPYRTLAWLLWYIQWEGLPTRSKASQVKHCSHPVFCKKKKPKCRYNVGPIHLWRILIKEILIYMI